MPSKDDLLITCIGGSIGWSWIVDESKFYYKDGNVVAFDKNNFIYTKLVDCLEKCLIYGHIRRFAN